MNVVMRPGQADGATKERLRKAGFGLIVAEDWELPGERALFVGPGVEVPWGLLDAGSHFLERWDAATPLWRYGVLAQDVGTEAERERTRALTLDLRVPLYAPELLFCRRSEGARALLAAWREECAGGANERLAFLRALCRVKPLFLALPRSWLMERSTAEARQSAEAPAPEPAKRGQTRLIHVEIAPGRSVCCRPEEAETYRERFAQMRARRRG